MNSMSAAISSEAYACRHSWSVMRLRPASSEAFSDPAGELGGHEGAVDDLALAFPHVGEDRAEVVGDPWAAGAGFALGAADENARGDPVGRRTEDLRERPARATKPPNCAMPEVGLEPPTRGL